MESKSVSLEIQKYLAIVWHWVWLLVLATFVTGVVTYFFSKQMTKVYQATTTLLVNQAPISSANDYASVLTSERLSQTYSEMLTKQPVLDGVAKALKLSEKEATGLASKITTTSSDNTMLITVKVEDTDPQRAADIANELVKVFSDQNQAREASRFAASKLRLETQMTQIQQQMQANIAESQTLSNDQVDLAQKDRLNLELSQYRTTYTNLLSSYDQIGIAEAQSTSSVVSVEPATAPLAPIRPRVLTNTILAMAAGFMLAILIVVLVEALDDTLKSPDDIARELKLPILGLIARYPKQTKYLIASTEPRAPVAEAFRSLRTNIQFASVDKPIATLLVTSPSPSDGKTTVAANLAVVIAQSGRSVALCEADLRRPRIHKIMNIANRRGLTDLFVQPQVYLDGALQASDVNNLRVLTSGNLPPNPSELLGSERMSDILENICQISDYMVIDTPPVLAVTDATVLATRVDAVLLVLKPGVTKLAAARQAVEQLHRVGANLIGVVLNDVEVSRSRYSSYHYRGYYSYDTHYYDPDGQESKSERKKIKKEAAKAE